jgi:hypothetical protein
MSTRIIALVFASLLASTVLHAEDKDSKVSAEAKTVGQKAGEAAHEVGEAGKEVGQKVVEVAREVGHATRDGAKEFHKAVTGKSKKKTSHSSTSAASSSSSSK